MNWMVIRRISHRQADRKGPAKEPCCGREALFVGSSDTISESSESFFHDLGSDQGFACKFKRKKQQLIARKHKLPTVSSLLLPGHDSHVSNSPTENDQTRSLLPHPREGGATRPACGATAEAPRCEIHEREPEQKRHKNESKCPKGIGTNRRHGPKRRQG